MIRIGIIIGSTRPGRNGDPDRIMFGSDRPVCLMAAIYGQVVDVLVQALPECCMKESG